MKCSVDVCYVHLSHNSFSSSISLLIFCLADLSSGESGMLKSPTTSVWGLIYDLSFNNVSFTYEGVPVFGSKMFRTEISS